MLNTISRRAENKLLDKYRKTDKQTIVIIGVLILSAKLCKADGHFSAIEEDEILRIVPHEQFQHQTLLDILKEGANDYKPIQEDARRLKKLVGEGNKEFLEFVVAVLYRLAIVDHIISDEEIRDIQIVTLEFGVVKAPLIDQIKEIALKFQKKLENNGLELSIYDLKKFLNQNIDSVEDWWKSKNVQLVIAKFKNNSLSSFCINPVEV